MLTGHVVPHNSGMANRSNPQADRAGASTLHLPEGNWNSVLDCLCAHFPHIPAEVWRDRFARGRVLDSDGRPLLVTAAYRRHLEVHYFREVAQEAELPFEACVLHADADLLVADKPHFLAVMPAGRFVEQTLLRRLIRQTGNGHLVPLHRIDRLTAGLVLFSTNPATRSRYQSLFREQQVDKYYEALAPALPQIGFPLVHRSRLLAGEPFFRMVECSGPANSETRVDVVDRGCPIWRYALSPVSGRKHQLRVHMASLGAPILNDPLYPELASGEEDDFDAPLKLLAKRIAFTDPLSGQTRRFESRLTL